MPLKSLLILMALFTACAPAINSQAFEGENLRPYATMAPTVTADPSSAVVQSSASILPTPTPFSYTIRAGDTMGQIAEKFNVGLDALSAANPEVDPNSMRVGETLLIPSNPKNATGESTPTPVPLAIEQVACYLAGNGGLWCFALVHNDSPDPIEDVTAQVNLLDAAGHNVGGQIALLPLDILPAGASLPLTVSFSPGLPPDVDPQVQVLTAIRILKNDPRYLDASVQNTQVQVDWSGLSAQASGLVHLAADSKPASRIWIAAVVYDGAGNVTGVRRWETSTAVKPDGDLPFSFDIASLAGDIERVDFVVEARP